MNPQDMIDKEVIYRDQRYEVRKYSERYRFFELGRWVVDHNEIVLPEDVVMSLEVWNG